MGKKTFKKIWLKKNLYYIIVSLIFGIFLGIFGGLTRNYVAFGGEDMVPFLVILIWALKYYIDKENYSE